jgi:AcrR family transcriptional regulator
METTKEHILITAYKLFLQKGFKGTSMNMLVKESGLSKGAFYHYFENKEQLFVESLDNLFFSFAPYNQSNNVQLKENLWENIEQYIENAQTLITKMQEKLGDEKFDTGFYKIMIDAFQYAPDFYKKIEKSNKRELDFWKKVFLKAKENSEIRKDLDVELLAYQVQYVQDGVGMQSIFTGEMEGLYTRFRAIFRQFYEIIKV